MKGTDWSYYYAPPDSSWIWKKITHTIQALKHAYADNRWLDSDSPYTAQSGYEWLRTKHSKVGWRFLCWNTMNVPKTSFIFWAFMHKRLLTKDRMARMGFTADLICDICASSNEDHDHLFYSCAYSVRCCRLLQQQLHVSFNLPKLVHWFSSARLTGLQRRFMGACHVALIYYVWMVRNEARLNSYVRRPEDMVNQIMQDIHNRFLRLNLSAVQSKDLIWLQSLHLT
ncbi:uncharacterized protein LOC141639064 [Silene latifolia]|uniref:uncharacterized protein LOC141639064 n=1 Tax=Silene latifolia TaxID=37657 RepID=UPI003D771450